MPIKTGEVGKNAIYTKLTKKTIMNGFKNSLTFEIMIVIYEQFYKMFNILSNTFINSVYQ